MRRTGTKRLLSAVLAIIMVLALMPAMAMPASAEEGVYILDATADLTAMAAGDKADGDIQEAGTDGDFTIDYSAKTKIDGSNKTFDDGYTASQRLNFGGASTFDPMKNAVKFTTSAPRHRQDLVGQRRRRPDHDHLGQGRRRSRGCRCGFCQDRTVHP